MRLLLRTGSATIDEIFKEVGSSAPSIRRDLARLEQRGLIRRTHGGAELVEPLLYEPFRFDSSFQMREQRMASEKRRIGLAAADMVQENETVGLTAGTTTTAIGRALRHRRNLQIVTNAINIGMELCNQPGIRTVMTGGTVPWAWSFSLTGTAALNFMENIYLDRLFLSATGIDAERGVTTLETDEAELFRKMQEHARQVILVADSSKFAKTSPAFVCATRKLHLIITDTGASDALIAPFVDQGVRVVRV
jgi:DeoR family transcriptional regulator of aga operon